jgi:hypothetical protein
MAKLKSKLNLTLAFVAGLFGLTNTAYAQESGDTPKAAGSSEVAKSAAEGSLSAGAIAAAVAAAAAIAAVADSGGGGSAAPIPTPAPPPAPAPTTAPAPAPTPAPTYIVDVTQDETIIENQVVNTTTQTTTETNRNQALSTNTNTTFTTRTNINKAITTNTSTIANTNTNGAITTNTQTTTDTEGDGASYLSNNAISVDGDADFDTGFITMDMDIVADADLDGMFEVTADKDFSVEGNGPQFGIVDGDLDRIVDEVMDVDGVSADVDTGVNVVTTATSATP